MTLGLINRSENTRYTLFDKRQGCLEEEYYRSDYELIFNINGRKVIKIGEAVEELHGGDIVAIGPYVPRNVFNGEKSSNSGECFSIIFRTRALGAEFINSKHFKIIRSLLSRTRCGVVFSGSENRAVFERACLLNNTFDFCEVIHLLGILYQLSQREQFKLVSGGQVHVPTVKRNKQLADEICAYVDRYYNDSLCVEDIANYFCMARSTFTRFFKSNIGVPFIKYLNKVRVRNACCLLESSNEPIASIAVAVGYASLSNFNNQFRLIMSVSPSRYREQQSVYA